MRLIPMFTTLVMLISFVSPVSAGPAVGEPAPSFSMKGSDGKTYTLAELKGHGGIVIAFFPKAFTGG